MFLWGDNAFEQLGIPLSVSTELSTKSFLPKPKLLAYMDLHAPKSVTCSNLTSTSHVSSLRELVAAAKPDPIRLGLTHVDAGDRFTMLVFTTKPGISRSSNVAGGEISESNSRMPPEASPETTTTTTTGSKWNFSLTDDLLVSAIPSRESAYYQFMVNTKFICAQRFQKHAMLMKKAMTKLRGIKTCSDDLLTAVVARDLQSARGKFTICGPRDSIQYGQRRSHGQCQRVQLSKTYMNLIRGWKSV
ncbi:hypothetical protein GQ600_25391 [Phytophthora cactorum]|nr:hypothetical protein GQ600_25391 [Phytophthora cactorum]